MILKDFGFKNLPIDFSDKGHRYKLNDFLLTGSSSITGMRKKDWKAPWSSKEAVRFLGYFDKVINGKKISTEHLEILKKKLEDRFEEIKQLTPTQFYNLLTKAKSARKAKSKPALLTGTVTHYLLQTSVEKGIRYKLENIIHENEQTQFEVRNCYQAFLNWEKKHVIEYFATELIVANQELFMAGTIDIIARIDGVMNILDFKTSKFLSDDVFLQTAIYKYILMKMLTAIWQNETWDRSVLRLDKGVDGNNMKIENFKPTFEYLKINSNYQQDLKCAMGLYDAYKWESYQKKNNFLNKKKFFRKY